MNKQHKLQVEAIKNGTVIDHIPANIGFKVIKLLKLDDSKERITIGLNLPSSALGKKDLIKIENYQVVAKLPLTLPKTIVDVYDCPNSNCITHDEKAIESSFTLMEKEQDIALKCKYCEKVFSREIMNESH